MAKSAQETRSYQININTIAGVIRTIGPDNLEMEVRSETPEGAGVWFGLYHGYSPKSWGENITITLTPSTAGTDVNIHSECAMPTQLFDAGKNKSNCQEIFEYIESGLARQDYGQQPYQQQFAQGTQQNYGQQPYQQQFAQGSQQSYARSDLRPEPVYTSQNPAAGGFIFCTQCGKKNEITDNFCSGCGCRLEK